MGIILYLNSVIILGSLYLIFIFYINIFKEETFILRHRNNLWLISSLFFLLFITIIDLNYFSIIVQKQNTNSTANSIVSNVLSSIGSIGNVI